LASSGPRPTSAESSRVADDDHAGAVAQVRRERSHQASRAEVVDLYVLLDYVAGLVIALDPHDRVGEDDVETRQRSADPLVAPARRVHRVCRVEPRGETLDEG
jgi:hypothetical protein